MRCKGRATHIPTGEFDRLKEIGALTPEAVRDLLRCGSEDWGLVWANALREEGTPVHLWQCKKCMRVVMATDRRKDSDDYA